MGQIVSFPGNGRQVQGYLVTPRNARAPGIVVIQEWWGLVPHIKDLADRLAREGFRALAPDLYHGKTTKEPNEAQKLLMELNAETAAKDMSGAVSHLLANGGGPIGSVGFCMGGAMSLRLATVRSEVQACVAYYPVLPLLGEADYARMRAAVLGHFAEHDDMAPPQGIRDLEATLRKLGKDVTFYTYPGTQHAFFNDTRPEVHDPAASKLSWERTLAFFKRHLGGA